MNVSQALNKVLERQDLSFEEAAKVAGSLMRGEATAAQVAGFLVALRMKGETVDEIAGFVRAMREAATPVAVEGGTVDIVGTGGDHAGTFNISTTTAFVVAGAGGRVAKHGNRGVSSRSGAADVLQTLGVRIDLSPEEVSRCVAEAGVGFLFAQSFHPAMKHVGPIRREMGVRTVFNLLGPLTNPAGTKRLVVGVYDRRWCRPLAEALSRLGAEKAWVVHGSDGLDEITLAGPTHVAQWDGDSVTEFDITPADAGLPTCGPDELKGGDPEANAAIARAVLAGEKGARRDVVVLNAAAALVVSGLAADLAEGAGKAQASIDSGAASRALATLVSVSGGKA